MMVRAKAALQSAVDSVTPAQVALSAGGGIAAQIATLYDVSYAAIVQVPFFALTYAMCLNWITGAVGAVLRGDFSGWKFAKSPIRWFGYVFLATLGAQGGLLLASTGMPDVAPAVLTAFYIGAFFQEGRSVFANLGASQMVVDAWNAIAERIAPRKPGDE